MNSKLTGGTWLFNGEPLQYFVFPAEVCALAKPEREYSIEDIEHLTWWINERACGYPALARFEGGKNWPL